MHKVWHDARYAVRTLLRGPGFTVVAVLTLALGIGANAAIFSVVYGVLLQPLPFPHPEQLVTVTNDLRGLNVFDTGISPSEIFDLRSRSGMFDEVAGVWPVNGNVTGMDKPERVDALIADVNYFSLLGVSAQLGRVFGSQDYTPGIGNVCVISDGLWLRHFGRSPGVLGKNIRLDNDLYTIIGVAPAGFRHPGKTLVTKVDFWAPSGWVGPPFDPKAGRRAWFIPDAIARLKPGISEPQARQRLDAFAAALRQDYPNDYPANEGWAPRLLPLGSDLTKGWQRPLLILLGAVGFVLLIACANVANLSLARAEARRREIAIRRALGATGGDLLRQWFVESALLAFVGAAVGLLLAVWGLPLLLRTVPASLPQVDRIGVGWPVVLFTLGASVVAGLLFGLTPALAARSVDVDAALKESPRGGSGGSRQSRVRHAVVVAEIALALVLLVCASLLVESLRQVLRVSPGFDAQNVLTANLWLPLPNEPSTGPYFKLEQRRELYREILSRLSTIPGVESVGGTSLLPLSGARGFSRFRLEGSDPKSGEVRTAETSYANAGYFRALRIPLLRGEIFEDSDRPDVPERIVVSVAFAQKYFGGMDPIGKRISFGHTAAGTSWATISGIAGDVRFDALDLESRPQIYRSQLRSPGYEWTLVVRSAAGSDTLANALRSAVQSVDPNLPVFSVQPMSEVLSQTLGQRRFAMGLIGLFALVAIALAALGIYGVMSYVVGQRTREIGVRMALGAQRKDVLRMVLGDGLLMAGVGVGLGLVAAAAATRLLGKLLFRVPPADPVAFALAAFVLVGVALSACLLPARRATRVDPMVALRYE
jgi:predicted permease